VTTAGGNDPSASHRLRPLPSVGKLALERRNATPETSAICSSLGTATAVLPKIPHSDSCKRAQNRPLRPRRGRFGPLLYQFECGIFGRTAVELSVVVHFCMGGTCCTRHMDGSMLQATAPGDEPCAPFICLDHPCLSHSHPCLRGALASAPPSWAASAASSRLATTAAASAPALLCSRLGKTAAATAPAFLCQWLP